MDPYRFFVMFAKSQLIDRVFAFWYVARLDTWLQRLRSFSFFFMLAAWNMRSHSSRLISPCSWHSAPWNCSQIAGPKAHLWAFELESLQKILRYFKTKLKNTNFERLQVEFDGLLRNGDEGALTMLASTCLGNHPKSSIFEASSTILC